MKEVDDTPLPKSESEEWKSLCESIVNRHAEQIAALELRIANLEARKPPQDTNPDPEWYA